MPLLKSGENIKSRTIAESVILLACYKIVNIIFDEKYKKDILKILMSDNIISRCVQAMSQDVELQMTVNFQEAEFLPFSWLSHLTSLEKPNS
jgi:hypothetical protein